MANIAIPTPQQIIKPGVGQSSFAVPASFIENQELMNVDYVISTTETLALKYFYAIAPSVQQFFGGGAFTAEPPGASALSSSGANNFGATLTSTFSNSLVNQVHYADNYISSSARRPQWPVTGC